MAFYRESKFANRKSQFRQGGKSNSTRNAYKITVILITRAKVMVLWSFNKNQSKFFLKLSTQIIPTAPAVFPIEFNVLEVRGGKFQVKTSTVTTRTKILKNEEKSQKKHYWNVENGIFWRIWVCKPAKPIPTRWEIKFHPKCI